MKKLEEVGLYLGLDVQVNRGCSYLVLNSQLCCVETGWLRGEEPRETCARLKDVLSNFTEMSLGEVAVGIDAPRIPLTKPREFYWARDQWRKKNTRDRGYGRHCEVVLKSFNIANPQWTPLADEAPTWMRLGFELFKSLEGVKPVYEVFPSASYAMLRDKKHPKVSIYFADFAQGPKDMLDACISALTVHQFVNGRGCELGGGDGLGTIILPTQLPVSSSHPVLRWPDEDAIP
jgi:predicted nuclease with RNAse H fold